MLTLVSEPRQVKKLYSEFRALLDSNALFPTPFWDFPIGHRGGSAATEAAYSPKLDVWTSPGDLHWNAFGVGKSPSMVVQINFQDYANKPRRVGAAFALDEANNPVVIHRGHIGGGKAGVGLTLMLNECRSEHAWLREENEQETECFVVGQLRSKFFAQQLANFVREVNRVKNLGAVSGLSGIAASLLSSDSQGFTSEKTGTAARKAGEIDLTHGLVVNELAKRLTTTSTMRGWDIRNDRHRDLMLTAAGELQVLFEVKTSVTTQSICTGLGQLLLYSTTNRSATLVLVLPEKLPSDLAEQLKRWNVQVLYYSWVETTPRFRDLSKFLARL